MSRAAGVEVSVLLPCRDAGRWLPDCIESLEAQTFGDYEVVAVDDGSRDETRELLESWGARDGRVRVLSSDGSHEEGEEGDGAAGLVEALNRAAGAARGRLLARMDADDIAAPRRLQAQRDALRRRTELAACGTAVELFPASAVGDGYERYERWLNSLVGPEDLLRDLLVECPIAHPTLMIRRSVFHALGGYRDAGWPEDYDLVLRLHAAGMRAANLDTPLLRWRVRADRHSLRSPRYSADAFRRCKAHFLTEAFLPGRPVVIWGAGKVGKPLARALLREGVPVRAFVDLDPRKIGQEIHGAPVLDPAGFERLSARSNPYVLAAVGSPGARREIREALQALGRRELLDFRACA